MDRMRILIAEDEALVALSLESMLQNIGHDVVAKAKNGNEAVDLADKTNPDLAIMDIRMPDMDGLEAARVILQDRPMPIVILTAHTDDELIRQADEIGVVSYLIKPVMEAALTPAIRMATSRFAELQELKKETETLKEALETRKLVERAKGILMKHHNLAEDEAFKLLQKQSSKRNVKMAELARMIVETSDLL